MHRIFMFAFAKAFRIIVVPIKLILFTLLTNYTLPIALPATAKVPVERMIYVQSINRLVARGVST